MTPPVLLITGTSSGIGLATAVAAARAGFAVVANEKARAPAAAARTYLSAAIESRYARRIAPIGSSFRIGVIARLLTNVGR